MTECWLTLTRRFCSELGKGRRRELVRNKVSGPATSASHGRQPCPPATPVQGVGPMPGSMATDVHRWPRPWEWSQDHFRKHHPKWNKPDPKGRIVWDATYMRSPEQSSSQRQKAERWLPGAGGGGNGEVVFKGCGVSAQGDEKVLWTDGGAGCTTVWMWFMPLDWTLKTVKW